MAERMACKRRDDNREKSMEESSGLHRPGLSGRGGVHGPRELGHGPCRRKLLRIFPDLGTADVQPDGPAAAVPERPVGDCTRAGSGPGFPQYVSAGGEYTAVYPC